MMLERASRTFICSVLFLDIVEYSRKPVAEQIRLKDRFNALIASAIREIPPADRIILDTGDGVAINFLGDPEDALFVAMSLRNAFAPDIEQSPEVPARIGINLGPVRLVRDLNGQPNIIGDGINVAQRVMGFAQAGQILVSRSYFEIVSHISESYTKLFTYQGSRTDKHVREHEIYSVGYSAAAAGLKSPAERARREATESRNRAASGNAATARLLFQAEKWLGNRSLAYGTAAFSSCVFLLALLTSVLDHSPQAQEHDRTAAAGPEITATATGKIRQEKPHSANARSSQQQADKVAAEGSASGNSAGVEDPREDGAGEQPAPTEQRKRLRLSFFSSRSESDSQPSAADNIAPDEDAQPDAQATASGSPQADAMAGSDGNESANTLAESGGQASLRTATNERTAATAGRASVALAITPWGEVYVDGNRVGVSPPLKEIAVTPGRRVIEIRNGDFPPYTQSVELKAKQRIKIRYKFN
jgi:hypothetical protein